jgi:hypothetical protein
VGFVDDVGAAALVPPPADGHFAFQVAELRDGERRRVHFLRGHVVRHFGRDEAGNGGLARAGLAREPVGPAGEPAAGERPDALDDLVLADDIGPRSGSVGLRERAAEGSCWGAVCPLFRGCFGHASLPDAALFWVPGPFGPARLVD